MYLRSLPGTTLEDLANEFDRNLTTWGGGSHQITPHLDEDEPHISFGSHDVFAGKDGLLAMAKFFDIPPKFFARLDAEQKQFLLRTQIEKADEDVTVLYREDEGVSEIYKAGQTRVRPHRLVEKALTTFPAESPIVDHWLDHNELRVDVILPEGFERGIGGDPGVGDITRGGVRLGQDRKLNMAPWVQPFLYRLVCTNGMEVPDAGLKVSALGATEQEIEALFEAEVARAMERLDQDIEHFYSLRSERVGSDPTGALRRAATEMGLPARTVGNLEDLVPSLVDEATGDISMFDVVNLMTNWANHPDIDVRSSSRRNLQVAGGRLVNDHAERCGTCHARLN
jgi:hypothetical protein